MTWKQYHRLEDIHQFLDYLAKTYPAHISIQSIGKSHEGRDLKVGIVFLWQSLKTKFFELQKKCIYVFICNFIDFAVTEDFWRQTQ